MGEAESEWSPVTKSGDSRVTWYFGKREEVIYSLSRGDGSLTKTK
jgi:hypothetical protein